MKKLIQKIVNLSGYAITKKKNFEKIYRTLDDSIKKIIIKENPVIFDVGAHEGETIKRFLKIYTNPKIYSFEPQKKCFQKLKSYKNKDCIIENIAFGEKKEVKSIFIYKDSSTSSLYNLSKNTKYNKDLNVESEETINIETLDNYVKKNNISFIDLLKIDTQGHEKKVLEGALETLRKKTFLLEVELIFVDYYDKKNSFYDLESILKPIGFELYSLSTPTFSKIHRIKWIDALYINKTLK